MGTCSRWLRLFINLTLEAMERHAQKPKHPVLLCLDEFPILGHLRQIEDAAGQIAGFGVKLMICLQDLTQIKSLYQDRWETFIGNAGAVVCFGNSDPTTLEFVSRRLGKPPSALTAPARSRMTSSAPGLLAKTGSMKSMI